MRHWLHDITLSSNASELLEICFPSILVVVLVLIIIKHATVCILIAFILFYFILFYFIDSKFLIRAAGSSVTKRHFSTTCQKLFNQELRPPVT